jgi:hypothetical protein
MSLLMFDHDKENVLVFTDTLATSMDGTPRNFSNKCLAIPTMNLVVAVTGLANFHERWVTLLRESMLARDITMLDLHAPEALRELWAQFEAEEGPLPSTCTLYHFGVDEESGECIRITYRSESNFESEYGDPGIAVKPPPEAVSLEEVSQTLDDLDGWMQLATLIRVEQDAKPIEDRVHVGGDIMLTALASDGSIHIRRLARFDDYEEHWLTMNRVRREEGAADGEDLVL